MQVAHRGKNLRQTVLLKIQDSASLGPRRRCCTFTSCALLGTASGNRTLEILPAGPIIGAATQPRHDLSTTYHRQEVDLRGMRLHERGEELKAWRCAPSVTLVDRRVARRREHAGQKHGCGRVDL